MVMNRRPAGPPGVPPEKGIELLERQIAEAQQLLLDSAGKETPAWGRWIIVTKNHLALAFGKDAPEVNRFENSAVWSHPSNFKGEVSLFTATLRGFIRALANSAKPRPSARARTSATAAPAAATGPVLLVTGRHAVGQEVARFLTTTLGLQVIVVDEREDPGSAAMDAASRQAGAVPFAVVVLAPDEIGGQAAKAPARLRRRACQDAVFALGFLVARLGPDRVCALLHDGVEMPSRCAGLRTVTPETAGRWQEDLAKELQGAGLPIRPPRAM
jgi:predicted nucleotide-binding protein